jgi:hypothetical protein
LPLGEIEIDFLCTNFDFQKDLLGPKDLRAYHSPT